MKIPAQILALFTLLLTLPMASIHAQSPEAAAQTQSYSESALQKFASAYRSVVILSQEYAPKLKAAADIQEAEAINQEAQGKMVAAINNAGLSKDEYQQIVTSLRSDPALLERVNKILQASQPPQ